MVGEINTFVFFDLEGTGLTDNPRITELSLMAIHRRAVKDAKWIVHDRELYLPRVINKLTVCMYPIKVISSEASSLTGLYNENLLNQKDMDPDLVHLVNLFLRRLEPPVCLVSHNGFRFDFPLLKAELQSIDCRLLDGILCIDTWEMCRDLDGSPVLDRSRFLPSSSGRDDATMTPISKSKKCVFVTSNSIKRKKSDVESAHDDNDDSIPCVRKLFQDVDDAPRTTEAEVTFSQAFIESADDNTTTLLGNSDALLLEPDGKVLSAGTGSPSRLAGDCCDVPLRKTDEGMKPTLGEERAVIDRTSGDNSEDRVTRDETVTEMFTSLKSQDDVVVKEKEAIRATPLTGDVVAKNDVERRRTVNNRWSQNLNHFQSPRPSYKLAEIHRRVVGCYPSGSHRAEDDCLALARIFMFMPKSCDWTDEHAVPFSVFLPLYDSPRKPLPEGFFPSYLD